MYKKPLVTVTQVPNPGKATFDTTDDAMLVIRVVYQDKPNKGDSLNLVAADTKANCLIALAQVTGITDIEYDHSCYYNRAPGAGSDLVFLVYNFEDQEEDESHKAGTQVWDSSRYGAGCIANIMLCLDKTQLREVQGWFNHEWE